MSYCDDCLHKEVCGEEGVGDESMTFCRDKVISCEDAISRQAVQDYIAKYLSQYLYNDVREAVEVIDEYIGELPSVTPHPKTGYWIELDSDDPYQYMCSECHRRVDDKESYCPSCGVIMKSEVEE